MQAVEIEKSLVLVLNREDKKDLRSLLRRGLNTWPDRPAEPVRLSDILERETPEDQNE